jgi:LCP family protein required for cell wall assembly
MESVKSSRIDRVNKNRRRKWVLRILSVFILVILGLGIYYGSQIWGVFANSKTELGSSKLRNGEVEIKNQPFTILLIGTDQRNPDSTDWRSDVLMIAAINPKTNTIKVMNIPRDTYAEIANTDGYKTKINAAAHWGYVKGINPVQNIRETVENLLNIPIDYYARINFQGFTDVVDVLGGVDVNVKFPFHQEAIGGKMVYFKPGPAHLNGAEALAYVRMRHQDPLGDHGRNIRQQEVLGQLMGKIASFQGISKFSELTKAVGRNFEYSFNISDIPSLISIYKSVPKQNIEVITMKTISEKRHGVWYEILYEDERERVSKLLQQQLEYTPKEPLKPSEAYPVRKTGQTDYTPPSTGTTGSHTGTVRHKKSRY